MITITETLYKKMPDDIKECFNQLPNPSSEEVLELFPNVKTGAIKPYITKHEPEDTVASFSRGMGKGSLRDFTQESSTGSAARFFYCAKASRSERNMGLDNLDVKQKFTAGNYSQSPVCKTCDLTLNGTNDHSECSGEVYYREMESKNTKNNHPTVKPVKLMEYLVNLVSKEGHTVLDPFAGSGTTGIACKKLNRNFIGIERDEEYCKIATARINSI